MTRTNSNKGERMTKRDSAGVILGTTVASVFWVGVFWWVSREVLHPQQQQG